MMVLDILRSVGVWLLLVDSAGSASAAYVVIIISVKAVTFIGRKINIIHSSSVWLWVVGIFKIKTFGAYGSKLLRVLPAPVSFSMM